MSKPFVEKLQEYYSNVSEALRNESAAASIFPNAGDIGTTRERIYVEFLRSCLPSACNVNLGGFLFNAEGDLSAQIDVIVTSDTCPQFNFNNRDGHGKTFSCIDGTLAVASLKSHLNRATLHEALDNLASLPSKQPLQAGMVSPLVSIPDYDDWPYKIVYAPDGVSLDTLEEALFDYVSRKRTRVFGLPNIIHVAGKYSFTRTGSKETELTDGETIPPHTFVSEADPSDAGALSRVVVDIQGNLIASRQILWNYRDLLGGFKIPIPGLSHVVTENADVYEERVAPGQPPSETIEQGTQVRILERYGEYVLIETESGERVQIEKEKLRPLR